MSPSLAPIGGLRNTLLVMAKTSVGLALAWTCMS
jgi:hypothetical protein